MENSRFKFRVWDSRTKRMLSRPQDIRMDLGTGNLHGKCSGGNVEEWVALQYTGLKDSKGVDIFEGDVIEDTDYKGIKITGSIVYRLGAFYIDWNTYPHSLLSIGTPTIVGNIYENKELLKEKK